MHPYKVFITLHPCKNDHGRGIRTLQQCFTAESEEQADDFASQYFEGFLKDGVTMSTKVFS